MEARYEVTFNLKSGKVEVRSLVEDFHEYYPAELLRLLGELDDTDVRKPTYQYFYDEYRKQLKAHEDALHIRTLLDNM